MFVAEWIFVVFDGNFFVFGMEYTDKAAGIATRYGLDGPGIELWWGARFSAPVHTGPGAHPASYTMGTGSFPEVKRSGRGADPHPYLQCRSL